MSDIRNLLDDVSLERLFLEELGWDHVQDAAGLDLNDDALRRYRP